jgi:hypothetical protein
MKQALAFSVGIGNSLVMLYLFFRILIFGSTTLLESSKTILIIEIIVTLVGIWYLWRIFKLNHKVMVI